MLKWLNGDVSDKGKIGITFGCMDLLHAGHVAMLAEAKQNFPVLNQEIQDTYTDARGFTQRHRNLELVFRSYRTLLRRPLYVLLAYRQA